MKTYLVNVLAVRRVIVRAEDEAEALDVAEAALNEYEWDIENVQVETELQGDLEIDKALDNGCEDMRDPIDDDEEEPEDEK